MKINYYKTNTHTGYYEWKLQELAFEAKRAPIPRVTPESIEAARTADRARFLEQQGHAPDHMGGGGSIQDPRSAQQFLPRSEMGGAPGGIPMSGLTSQPTIQRTRRIRRARTPEKKINSNEVPKPLDPEVIICMTSMDLLNFEKYVFFFNWHLTGWY